MVVVVVVVVVVVYNLVAMLLLITMFYPLLLHLPDLGRNAFVEMMKITGSDNCLLQLPRFEPKT